MHLSFLWSCTLLFLSFNLCGQSYCECAGHSVFLSEHELYIENGELNKADSAADKIALKTGEWCKYLSLYLKSDLLVKRKLLDSCITLISKSELFREQLPCFDTLKAMCSFLLAKSHHMMNNKDSAVKYQLLCSDICEKNGYREMLYKSYANLGIMLGDIEQPDKAVYYQLKAVDVLRDMKDTAGLARLTILVAGSYGTLYDRSNKIEHLDSVLYYLERGMPLAKASRNRKALIHGYDLYAGYYNTTGDQEMSLLYCDSAIALIKRPSDNISLTRVFITKSSAYSKLNKAGEAVRFADSALFLAEGIGQVDLIIAALNCQVEANVKLQRFDAAFNAQVRLNHLNDSLVSLEKMHAINELEQKYNKARNEEAIMKLTHEAEIKSLRINILILSIVGLLVLLISVLVFFRQRALKNRQLILETEQRLNRARMNPHFFFNALTTLQTYAMKPGNNEMVPIYLAKYSRLMRQTLESTYSDLIPVADEVGFIRNYLDLQKLINPGKFEYVIDTSNIELEIEELLMPSMIVQPFIENSVEHGFRNMNRLGEIRIVFRVINGQLHLTIRDNGSASGTSSNHEGFPSRATQIITDRLFLLDKSTGSESYFNVGQNEDGKGYLVKITLPLILK